MEQSVEILHIYLENRGALGPQKKEKKKKKGQYSKSAGYISHPKAANRKYPTECPKSLHLMGICVSWPWPWPPNPTCIWRPQLSICVYLFFVLQLKFDINTVFTYINHSPKKRKGFSFLMTMYNLSVYLYVLSCYFYFVIHLL